MCSASKHAKHLCCKFSLVSIITIHFEREFLVTIEGLELNVITITSGKLWVVVILTISLVLYWAVYCVYVTAGHPIFSHN